MKGTILVTGGTGFIGSHTTVELQQAGYEVVIIDNLSNSNEDVLDGIEKITGIRPAFEKVDLRDLDATEAVFKKYPNISGVIHFAASKAVGESVQKPLLYYHNNIVSLINVLQLMPKYGVKGIIFSSSCTVYGQPDVLPVTEDSHFVRKFRLPPVAATEEGWFAALGLPFGVMLQILLSSLLDMGLQTACLFFAGAWVASPSGMPAIPRPSAPSSAPSSAPAGGYAPAGAPRSAAAADGAVAAEAAARYLQEQA